ncbi:NUDIX domain-containing protein (plasmid) [Streptomyces sp. NBC_00513]|uniref:NUDIX domain-containing protein n=1 Tax=unclassified Streptomyces TaxID=2593676 RepID=UPI002257B30C|nr:NUDIX domain-containing protein [Streptomyces sp. NBC_00424]MCX5079222.1 NUDIX domain-containing protein [Streptomyces sp. NBC_00424]WUD46407.1 NUDIX domain-containing protein [Streptomyces sp. NBC_00513]
MTVTSDLALSLAKEAEAEGITSLVAAAVVTDTGRVLLLRRKADDYMGGLWEIPSGKVDPGETILDAASRETREETGLTVSSVDRYLGHFDYENSRGTTTRQFNFAVTVTETGPVLLTEHDLHRWAALTGDLPGVTDAVRKILTSA